MKTKYIFYNVIFLGLSYSIYIGLWIGLKSTDDFLVGLNTIIKWIMTVSLFLFEFVSFIDEIAEQSYESYQPKGLIAFIYNIIKNI